MTDAAGEKPPGLRYDAIVPHPDPVRALKDSTQQLGALLEAAGDRAGNVPEELWREIAEAAVRVAAAAQMLAGDTEEHGAG